MRAKQAQTVRKANKDWMAYSYYEQSTNVKKIQCTAATALEFFADWCIVICEDYHVR